jgi:hypothetical protein
MRARSAISCFTSPPARSSFGVKSRYAFPSATRRSAAARCLPALRDWKTISSS